MKKIKNYNLTKTMFLFMVLLFTGKSVFAQVVLHAKLSGSNIDFVRENAPYTPKVSNEMSIKNTRVENGRISSIDGCQMTGVTDRSYIFAIEKDIESLIFTVDSSDIQFRFADAPNSVAHLKRIEISVNSTSHLIIDEIQADTLILSLNNSFATIGKLKVKYLFIILDNHSDCNISQCYENENSIIYAYQNSELNVSSMNTQNMLIKEELSVVQFSSGKIKKLSFQLSYSSLSVPYIKGVEQNIDGDCYFRMKEKDH